jgi:hypothetical protein
MTKQMKRAVVLLLLLTLCLLGLFSCGEKQEDPASDPVGSESNGTEASGDSDAEKDT